MKTTALLKTAGCLLLALPMLADGAPPASAQIWRLDSFRGFSEGSLPGGGVNIYTAADGTVRLINAYDLNRDGLPDVFLPSTHGYKEATDLSIYWDDHGYSPKRVTHLPTEGGKAAAVADLNRDGYPDIIVVNSFNGTTTRLRAYIYWGGKDGFSPERRTLLPTQGAVAVAVADLKGDGWPDIVIANSGLDYHESVDEHRESYIYWNDHGNFSTGRRTVLPSINGKAVAVADLNGDGSPDIVLVSAGNKAGEAGARIFWGDHGRYDAAHSTFLPGEGCTGVAIGDLNRDGRPDIVLSNGVRLKGREAGIYDIVDTVSIDSYIYWNSAKGFDPAHRTGLPTVAASGAAIADLDGDGWPEVIFSNGQGTASFVYWGSPRGFLTRRRLALPTSNAAAVVAADLNQDGHPDLIFANFNQGKNFDTDSTIYWGGAKGPDAKRHQSLPTSGASGIVVADLNQKGRRDLIFINKQSGVDESSPSTLYLSDRNNPRIFSPDKGIEIASHALEGYSAADLNRDGYPDLVLPGDRGVTVLWGGEHGYEHAARTVVSTTGTFSVRIADFNRDGYLDLMMSEWSPGSVETHVYYGGPGGFSTAFRTALPVSSIRFGTIADFNKDGWLDVAFPVFDEDKIVIFWGGPDGFKADRRTELKDRSAMDLEVADLRGSGYLDLISPNFMDQHPTPEEKTRAFGGSPEGGVFIYWGSAAGYSYDRRTVLPAIGAADVSVADLKRDGRLDLVVSSYHGGYRRDLPSYIYWQGPKGFDPKLVTRLPTNSASGNMVADFNGDGWPDILIANHQKDSDHHNNSYIYWGGPDGFSPARRLELPAYGPHFLTADFGNIYDRRPSYDYLSPAKRFESATRLLSLEWKADTPPGTAVRFQIRSAASKDELAKTAWEGPEGAGSAFAAPVPAANVPLHGPWFQFKAMLDNPGGGLPVLRSVTVECE